jgi:SAM-dependent methyltransferase
MSWLTNKLSRLKSDAAISAFASQEPTLEIGAYGSPSYGRYFPNRIGIDIRQGPGVDRVASVYELPFADNTYSVVLCMSVLEHLERPADAIAEMRRVLKPEGRIVVSVPFLFPIHDAPGDYWRFTKYGLRYLFRSGWQIEVLIGESTTQEAIAILLQRIAYQTKMRANTVSKFIVLLTARVVNALPTSITGVFGDIKKKVAEPDAFTSAFFLVARKS